MDSSDAPAVARLRAAFRMAGGWCVTGPGRVTATYLLTVVAILAAGGLSVPIANQRIAFRTVGYSLHPLLYGWIAYAWHTHRQGRWDIKRLAAEDPRLRPFLLWFVLPVTVWLASPHPNHIKDLVYLVINIPMGPDSTQLGLAAYLTAVRADYFAHPAVFVVAVGVFLSAAARYRRQPPLVQLLILTAALQFAMVTAHHTRDPRFLLLAMPPFWIVSTHELSGWLARRQPRVAMTAAVVIMCAAVGGAYAVTSAPTFRRLAAEHYVASAALTAAFSELRAMIPPEGDVAVIGRRDTVSPSLVKWQLGPPSGQRRFPHEITREADLPRLDTAAMVIVVEPSDVPVVNATTRVKALVEAGTLVPSRAFAIADLAVSIQVFLRADRH